MRLEITRRADLALRALRALSDQPNRIKAAALAEQLGTTAGFVPQVLGPLVRAGWVRSDPGPTGGYSLSTTVAELSVLDVIDAVDGPTDRGLCVVENRRCDTGAVCDHHDLWTSARDRVLDAFAAESVAPATSDDARELQGLS